MDYTQLLGWVPFEERTDEQNEIHNAAVAKMPAFGLVGEVPPVGTKILLTDYWKHPDTVEQLGFAFLGWHQFSGSCVGVGGGNILQTTNILDALLRGQPERIGLIAWAYNYGRSRLLAGMRGQGEGSMGATFAKSASEDGSLFWDKTLGLPDFKVADQLTIGKSQELIWSDGNHASQALRNEAKPHKFSSAPVNSGPQVRDAIVNGYGCTRAFGKFANPGTATVKHGALIGSYNGRGGHQEGWVGYWNHPDLGELIYEMNQWGADVYGTDPGGGAKGGLWLPLDLVHNECQSQYSEVYAFSSFEGYPAQPKVFDWSKQSIWS
jgi:hypothetical protein